MSPDSLIFADDAVADVASAWASTLGCVERMSRWSRDHASPFVVLELPPGSPAYAERACAQLRARGEACDPEGPRRRLAENARTSPHAFLTPIEAFRKAWREGDVLQFRWDGHYNAAGHRLVGRFLAERLPPLLAVARPRGRATPPDASPGPRSPPAG